MVKSEVEREVLALVLITIIIVSLLGTWAILGVIDQKQVKNVDNYYGNAQVSLVILPLAEEQTQESNQGESS